MHEFPRLLIDAELLLASLAARSRLQYLRMAAEARPFQKEMSPVARPRPRGGGGGGGAQRGAWTATRIWLSFHSVAGAFPGRLHQTAAAMRATRVDLSGQASGSVTSP